MKKRGFTLVELLAVIIILAVIALIATPLVLNVVDSAKKSAWESSAYGIMEAVKMNSMDEMLAGDSMEAVYEFPSAEIEIQGMQPTGGQASVDKQGKVAIAIHNEKWCALKDYDDAEITLVEYDGECTLGMEIPDKDETGGNGSASGSGGNESGGNSGSSSESATMYLRGNITTDDGLIIEGNSIINYIGSEKTVVIPANVTGTPVRYEVNEETCIPYIKEILTTLTDVQASLYCNMLVMQDPHSMYEQGLASTVEGDLKITNIEFDYDACVQLSLLEATTEDEEEEAKKECQIMEQEFKEMPQEEILKYPEDFFTYYALGLLTGNEETINDEEQLFNIEKIGVEALRGKSLTGVDFSQATNLTTLEEGAFYSNSITNLTLPQSLKRIEKDAFYNNGISGTLNLSNLTNLEYLSGFFGNSITEVIFPTSLLEIGPAAFSYNKFTGALDLSTLTNLKYLSGFNGNTLTSINLPVNLLELGTTAFASNDLEGTLDLKSLTKLTTIGEEAFYDNNLTAVEIPNSVTKIVGGAFTKNKFSEATAYVYGRTETGSIDNTRLVSYAGTATSLTVPSNVTIIDSYAFYNCGLTSVTIPEGVLEVKNNAFSSNSITTLSLPSTLTRIEDNAFGFNSISGALDLSHLTNLKYLSGFYHNSITSVTIPESVEEIGDHAFAYNDLTTVTIPKNVTIIDYAAFYKDYYTDKSKSNTNLTTIINKTGRSFNWSDVTGASTSGQNFETGTITHEYGNITVNAE